jgi:transposase
MKLLEPTLDNLAVEPAEPDQPAPQPERLIVDRGYDSDELRLRLAEERKIEVVCPPKSNRKVILQDGRPLRRYCRRWKIERTFACLSNFRRLSFDTNANSRPTKPFSTSPAS